MKVIRKRIYGIPYGQIKPRGDKSACENWSSEVRSQTIKLPKVKGPCVLRVIFILPGDHCPTDHPYGNDLDNLLKRFCDALQKTVLANAPGRDGAIVRIEAEKILSSRNNLPGAKLEVLCLNSSPNPSLQRTPLLRRR
jgi:Holliday junction resolvase RusA-like endonuclease